MYGIISIKWEKLVLTTGHIIEFLNQNVENNLFNTKSNHGVNSSYVANKIGQNQNGLGNINYTVQLHQGSELINAIYKNPKNSILSFNLTKSTFNIYIPNTNPKTKGLGELTEYEMIEKDPTIEDLKNQNSSQNTNKIEINGDKLKTRFKKYKTDTII